MKTLVIGASGELGAAIARTLAAEQHELILHGHKNVIGLNNLADEIGATATLECDVRDEEQVRTLIHQANVQGPISGLVYTAGINPTAETIANTSTDVWSDTIAINLTGAFLCVKYALPYLRSGKPSAIVIVSSVFGLSSPAHRGAYGASKHGLTGLIQSVAREEGEAIRINGVCPGPMWSENVRRIFARHAKSVGISVEDYVKQRQAQIPYGRFLQPQECASIVSFLLSDRAGFLTGEMIRISGGEF
ncbi:MAG: hypothetical protein QOD28_512 [Acidobacteriota bacterium]|nr:hypothetical protein [Acidobacteriota bacterium]